MSCFKARLNSLGSIWYTVLVVALQSYLVYLGVERYKLYTELKWPTGGYPAVWLNIYAILYAVCLPLLLMQFAFGFFKSGNIPGDNERLADRGERVIELKKNKNTGESTGCMHRLKSLWQHSPPLPQTMHIAVAICMIVAQQILIAQLYRHGFINSGDFLNTEMDFLFQRARQLAMNLPMGDTRLQGFRITADELSGSPLAPNILPLLMHVRLFGIPLEFFNFVLALLAYSIAYPSVFWRVSKPFALLFTLHLLIYSICLVFSYLAFTVHFRIQETNHHSARPVGLGQHLVHSRQFPFYHSYTILGTFIATTVLTSLAPISLYAYGYNKYFVNVLNCQAKNNIRGGSGGAQSEYSEYRRRNYRPPSSQLCCDGYGPHTTAIVLLVLIVIAKAPAIYALMILYQYEDKPFLLTCIACEVVYLFTWIILWLILTLKRDWDFKVTHQAHEIYALQKGVTHGHVRVNTNPSNLKNALVLVHRDHMFVTDDQTAKQSLLRSIQQNNFMDASKDDNYWVKQNGQQSPSTRKIPMEEGIIRHTPEASRLIPSTTRRQSIEEQPAYHSVNRSMIQQPMLHPQLATPGYRGNSSPPGDGIPTNTFGTLQRTQNPTYMSTLTRHQAMSGTGTLQRRVPSEPQWQPHESYASIHKPKEAIYGRRGSQDDGSAFSSGSNYASGNQYGTYARLPPQQSRLAGQSANTNGSNMRLNGGGTYAPTGMTVRRPSDHSQTLSLTSALRQSPQTGQRQLLDTNGREPSPYQSRTGPTGVKLSSFNGSTGSPESKPNSSSAYGSIQSQWAPSQRTTPLGQQPPSSQQPLWNQNNKQPLVAPLSSSSSQQDNQCFTPTSTLTSQGSNYSSNRTPTRDSPASQTTPNYMSGTSFGRNGGSSSGLYGNVGDDFSAEGTLQRALKSATGTTSVRHTVKIIPGATNVSSAANRNNDDSANFSLTSSNGSNNTNNTDFATSVV